MSIKLKIMKKLLTLILMMTFAGALNAQGFKGLLNKAKEKLEKATNYINEVNKLTSGNPSDEVSQGESAKREAPSNDAMQKETASIRSVSANNSSNIKIVVKGISTSLTDVNVDTNIQFSLPDIDKDNCACFILMTNGMWKEDLSIEEFAQLSRILCHKEFDLSNILNDNKSGSAEVSLPLLRRGLVGKDSLLYLRAYIINAKSLQVVAKGDFTKFNPGSVLSASHAKGIESSLNTTMQGMLLEGIVNSLFDDSSSSSSSDHECSVCGNSNICMACYGYWDDSDERRNCSHCRGSGRCPYFK